MLTATARHPHRVSHIVVFCTIPNLSTITERYLESIPLSGTKPTSSGSPLAKPSDFSCENYRIVNMPSARRIWSCWSFCNNGRQPDRWRLLRLRSADSDCLSTDTGVSRKRDCGFRVAGRSQRCGNSGEQNFRFIARRRLGRGISRQRHKSTSHRHESAGPTSTSRNRISRPRFHDGLGAPVRHSRSTIPGVWRRYSCHPRRGSQNRPLAAPSAVPGLPGRRRRQRLP